MAGSLIGRLFAALAIVGAAGGTIILAFTLTDRSPGGAPPPGAISPLTIASFNIPSASFLDRNMPWEERADAVELALRRYSPDIVGLQEVRTVLSVATETPNLQLSWLIDTFPDYALTGCNVSRYPVGE